MTSTVGKVLSVVFFILFSALALNTITAIFLKVGKQITNIQTIDSTFVPTEHPNFYSHLHLVTYLQLFDGSGGSYSREETKRLMQEYYNSQVFFFNARSYKFSHRKLEDLECGGQDNVIIYCYDFEMTDLQDFFYVSLNKHVLKTETEFKEFVDNSVLRLQFDYYFLPYNSETKYYFNRTELDTFLDTEFPNFNSSGYIDYVKQSRSSFDMRFDKRKYDEEFNNPIINLKIIDLLLDEGVIFSIDEPFASYTLDNIEYPFSPNVLSITFKPSSVIEGYTFKYKKIGEGLSEIAGVIQFTRIVFLVICVFVNSLKQQAFFSSNMYSKKITFINGEASLKRRNSVYYQLKRKISTKHDTTSGTKNISKFSNPENTNVNLIRNNRESTLQNNMSSVKGMINNPNDIAHFHYNKRLKLNEYRKAPESGVSFDAYRRANPEVKKRFFLTSKVFLKMFCSCSKQSKLERRLFKESMERNEENLDIMRITERLRRLDVLAYLLLDDYQFQLFKYVEKDQIIYDCLTNKVIFRNKCNPENAISTTRPKIMEYLIKMNQNPESGSEVDQKLFNVLDENLKTIVN